MINLLDQFSSPKHGGNLHDAIEHYKIESDRWLDLSSGISPWSWPVPKIPSEAWQHLPPPQTELISAASFYYDCLQNHITPTPGSQLSIRLIPQLLPTARVAVPDIGYQEHAHSWQLAGHQVIFYQDQRQLLALIESRDIDHAVIINPNNPSSEYIEQESVSRIASIIPGLLIIDEAFMDLYGNHKSIVPNNLDHNIIVLRSVGKFFGLAGLRVGFVITAHAIRKQLRSLLEPWSISHASQLIATQALLDNTWANKNKQRIRLQNHKLEEIIRMVSSTFLNSATIKNGGLFITVFANADELKNIHEAFATHGVWTRLHNPNDTRPWLRFGLPDNISTLSKVAETLCNK